MKAAMQAYIDGFNRSSAEAVVALYADDATVEDPVMFTKPWVITPRYVSIARSDDYLQPQMCSPHDEGHLIKPTAADTYKCGWCQKDAEAIYGEGATKTGTASK